MINTRIESRYSSVLGEFSKKMKIFKGYEKMVVLLISNLDFIMC
jgi:hypothetical protein